MRYLTIEKIRDEIQDRFPDDNTIEQDQFFSDEDILHVSLLINLHMRPFLAYKHSDKAEAKDRKLFGDKIIDDVLILHECDKAAH